MKQTVWIIDGIDVNADAAGGIETFVRNLVKYLENDINFEFIGLRKTRKGKYKVHYMNDYGISNYRLLVDLIWKSKKILGDDRGLIHIQKPIVGTSLMLAGVKNPIVCTIHGNPHLHYAQNKNRLIYAIYTIAEKVSIRRCTSFICVDPKTLDYYNTMYPSFSSKFTYLPIGVDTEVFYPRKDSKIRKDLQISKGSKIILYVGRFVHQKGITMIIKAVNEIIKKKKDIYFLLIGDGPQKYEISELIRKSEPNRIHLLGVIGHDSLPQYYSSSDVLVVNSDYEGMPTVAIESLACGTPVVSTDVGLVKEYITKSSASRIMEKKFRDVIKCVTLTLDSEKQDESMLPEKFKFQYTAKFYRKLYRGV